MLAQDVTDRGRTLIWEGVFATWDQACRASAAPEEAFSSSR